MGNNPNNSAAKIVAEQHDMIHAANGLSQERDYFPTSRFIGRLAQCRAWGGNYLLNFGPDPDGDLPSEAYNAI